MAESDLIEFYGTECVHCRAMKPLVDKLKAELKIEMQKLEIWHNEENAKIFRELDQGKCGGVPFFYNKKTGKWICGQVDYGTLKKWALGE